MPAFQLQKWYLDGVAADGVAVVVYWARIRYGPISLNHSAVLDARGREVVTRTSWKTCDPPTVESDRVVWKNKALGVDAAWRTAPRVDGKERVLLASPRGDVRWNLIMPWAMVTGNIGGSFFVGSGYVERLEMTLPPWDLPIDELRWGRAYALGDTAARCMTWIDWRGPQPLTLVLVNQHELADPRVSDTAVSGKGLRIELAPPTAPGSRVLRDGPLVTGALKGAPGLSRWAPASILAAHETKRLSRCVIHDPRHGDLHGWSIHEVVRFRQGRGA